MTSAGLTHKLLLIVSIVAVVSLNRAIPSVLPVPYPSPTEVNLATEDAVTNASLLTLGMRRLAADIMLIRTIVYYGTKESEMSLAYQRRIGLLPTFPKEEGHEGHDHEEGLVTHGPRGIYPDLGPRARQMIVMDPFWTYPPLWVAGALAFNQNRPKEAVEVLRAARKYLPDEKRYITYIAAIAFHKDGDLEATVKELTPLLGKDSPTMVKNMVAFMNVRLGHKRAAALLYLDILESRDTKYHKGARRALKKLGFSLD